MYPETNTWDKPTPRPNPIWWYRIALAVITVVALLMRAVGVGNYAGLIYDEYYYVPAADVLLRRSPPVLIKHMVPGIDPNLLSHPPFAKELIAVAIYTLGNHPWVWRLPGVILGTLVPLAVAGIAYELFRHRGVAIVAALLASVDGLLVTMSRVALPDSSAVPLAVGSLWVLLRLTRNIRDDEAIPWWTWAGFGTLLGLGLAAEWIGGQTLLVVWGWFMLAGQKVRKRWVTWVPVTTLVPFAIYYLSYFYAWPTGYHQPYLPKNPFVAFFKLQWLMLKGMWTLKFFHPWTSNALTWLLIPRPTALLLQTTSTWSIRLMAFSDPLIVWLGMLGIIVALIWGKRFQVRRWPWVFLLLWIGAFYGTWLTTPRSKFLYYFTTASVGLDIAAAAGLVLGYQVLERASFRRVGRIVWGATSAVAVLSILYLIPLWTGMKIPRPFYHDIWWPKSWNAKVRTKTSVSTASFSLTYHPKARSISDWKAFSPNAVKLRSLPVPWTVFRGNINHNSAYSAVWQLHKSYALTIGTSVVEAPTVSGDNLFVGTNNDQVDDVNILTGTMKWTVGVPNMVMTAPLVDRGLVVVGLGNNAFRDYTRSNGWIRGTGVNGLMALNEKTGELAWYYATTGEDMATPVISDAVVYEVTGSGRLIAVNLTSGKLEWPLGLAGFDSMSSPIIINHTLYVATNRYRSSYPASKSTVYAINLTSHRVVWTKNLPVASGLSDCSIASNGSTLFISGVPHISDHGLGTRLSNRLYALDDQTGQLLWNDALGSGTIPKLDEEEEAIPLVENGVVYVGSPLTHLIRAISIDTGKILWDRTIPTSVTGNPVLVNQELVVPGMNGDLYLMNAKTGKLLSTDHLNEGGIGPASPLIVSNALIEVTLTGNLVVQQVGH